MRRPGRTTLSTALPRRLLTRKRSLWPPPERSRRARDQLSETEGFCDNLPRPNPPPGVQNPCPKSTSRDHRSPRVVRRSVASQTLSPNTDARGRPSLTRQRGLGWVNRNQGLGRLGRRGRAPRASSLAQVVSLAVIPPVLTGPNQTALTRIPAEPDLPRPNWTLESRCGAVIS
jgi:hypothetical protein